MESATKKMTSNIEETVDEQFLKEIQEKYQKKKDLKEHVLLRPDMYMGKIYDEIDEMYVMNNGHMEKQTVQYNPGILKLFDEIIMNALDQTKENKSTNEIKITVDRKIALISVFNNGKGIPIVVHPEHGVYIPEMIFSQYLTSTNYDDTKKRLKAGLNGYGAKITSTFSLLFKIETANGKQLYVQEFLDNLNKIEPPKITPYKGKEFTKITFFPDLKRFKVKEISEYTFKILEKRAFDLTACTNGNVRIWFNDQQIPTSNFDQYTNLYIPSELQKEKLVVETERWKVCVCSSSTEEFQQVSFVNGIYTNCGGTHVNYIVNQIVKNLSEKLSKKLKIENIKSQSIRENLFVVVLALIENPSFKSQSKEELTTKQTEFGSTFEFDESHFKKIANMKLVSNISDTLKFKELKSLSASDGKKTQTLRGIPKLDDAIAAGGKRSEQCVLILTEGDSAKTFAVSGLQTELREFYGIFPLKGKFLNVRDVSPKQLAENEEIKNLKAILGLQNGKEFKNLQELKKSMRYGKVMVLTDADVDGYHIKGLLMNFFHYFWPMLVEDDTFVMCMRTPVVKATKGKIINAFYTAAEFKRWRDSNSNPNSWKIKYYKGLGTSSSAEAKECFKDLEYKKIYYKSNGKEDIDALLLGFKKDLADSRKVWIQTNSGKEIPDLDLSVDKIVPISKYINQELILFSLEDCERSIPSLCDGLKPSQRKVIYGTIKKNTLEEIKVDQLRGYIGEQTAYHHGDASLNQTIINMSHDFVGANNINLLIPSGQLGTRLALGKDAASPRYISVKLNPMTNILFDKKDNCLLSFLDEDGFKIEPEYYVPIIPLVLVNGAVGIATGYATDIPQYNPKDIIKSLRKLIKDENAAIEELVPWYRGFTGTISKNQVGKWTSTGIWERKSKDIIRITELPVGVATENYKEFLDDLMVKYPEITNIIDRKTDTTVDFEIHANFLFLDELISDDKLIKTFRLQNTLSENLVLFDEHKRITRFSSVEEILYKFFLVRKSFYEKRYKNLFEQYSLEIAYLSSKIVFMKKVMTEEIKVFRVPKATIVQQIVANGFKAEESGTYNYLLDIRIHQFSEESIVKLEKDLEDLLKVLENHKMNSPCGLWIEDLDELEKLMKTAI